MNKDKNNDELRDIVEKLKRSKDIKKTIVATSTSKSDDKIEFFCKKKKLNYFRGSLQNVYKRYSDLLTNEKCDFFILALNSDSSVKKIKGLSRPIIDQRERSEILAHYDFIDRIIIFDEKTLLNIIKKIRPKFLFKGDDYKISQVVGAKEI